MQCQACKSPLIFVASNIALCGKCAFAPKIEVENHPAFKRVCDALNDANLRAFSFARANEKLSNANSTFRAELKTAYQTLELRDEQLKELRALRTAIFSAIAEYSVE